MRFPVEPRAFSSDAWCRLGPMLEADGPLRRDGLGAQPAPSLYYLRTFQAVATERSFTRAGRSLDLSQPAVSAHIRTLERYYRGKLFETRQRRVHLTAEGKALFEYTTRVFNLLDEASRSVAATQRAERGLLRLGASPTVGAYLLPSLLGGFKHEHPGVEIAIAIGTSADIVADVVADRLPFGLVEASVSHQDLTIDPLGEDEMVLVVPPDHSLARGVEVDARELADVPLLRREAASGTQALVDSALQRAGVSPPTLMELGSPEALKAAVLAGIGVAWIPRLSIARELATKDLVRVRVHGLSVRRILSMVRRRDISLVAVAEPFLDLVRIAAGALERESPSGLDGS
jgi:DNA-binding transcriptional LysR family regulator